MSLKMSAWTNNFEKIYFIVQLEVWYTILFNKSQIALTYIALVDRLFYLSYMYLNNEHTLNAN